MKKSFTILSIMFLCIGASLQAQDSTKVPVQTHSLHVVEFGLRLMPTLSSFDMKTSSGGTVRGTGTLGFGVGAALAINFTKHIGVQGEIMYNSLSQKYKDQDLDRKINVRYVNIPLLLSLNTGKTKPVNLNLVLGPQIGFNVGSSISSSGNSSSDTLTTVWTTKKSDFGFAYGAGLEFALNESRNILFDLGFRGVYGFVNISNTSQPTSNNSYYILDRAKVRTQSGYIGIKFLF